jgi:hypothetical protein
MKSSVIYITENLIKFLDAGESQDKAKTAQLDISGLKKEEIPHALRNFVKSNKFQPEYLILGIPRNLANIRYFSFPALSDNEIRSMMGYDLTSRFAYKEDELVFDHAVIRKTADGFSNVLLAAVSRQEILPEFAILKHAGLIPDEAALSTVSLFNQLVGRKKTLDRTILVYFDDGFVEFLYLDRNTLEFSRAVNFKSGQLGNLALEIKHTLSVLNTMGLSINKAIIAGKSPEVSVFLKPLEEITGVEVEQDDSLDTLKGYIQESGYLKLSMLPEEFRIRKVKEIRARSMIYLGILLLLNVSLIANIAFFKIKTKNEYLYLLKSEIRKIDPRASGLQKKMAKTIILRSYINGGALKLGLLSEIYRSTPEGILLSSLDLSGNKGQGVVVLTGQSQDPESVIKFTNSLKASPFIEKTDVTYINKRKMPGVNSSDFEIRASF